MNREQMTAHLILRGWIWVMDIDAPTPEPTMHDGINVVWITEGEVRNSDPSDRSEADYSMYSERPWEKLSDADFQAMTQRACELGWL